MNLGILFVLLFSILQAKEFNYSGLLGESKAELIEKNYGSDIYNDLKEIVVDEKGLPQSVRGDKYTCNYFVVCRQGLDVVSNARFRAVYDSDILCVSYAPEITRCSIRP